MLPEPSDTVTRYSFSPEGSTEIFAGILSFRKSLAQNLAQVPRFLAASMTNLPESR